MPFEATEKTFFDDVLLPLHVVAFCSDFSDNISRLDDFCVDALPMLLTDDVEFVADALLDLKQKRSK